MAEDILERFVVLRIRADGKNGHHCADTRLDRKLLLHDAPPKSAESVLCVEELNRASEWPSRRLAASLTVSMQDRESSSKRAQSYRVAKRGVLKITRLSIGPETPAGQPVECRQTRRSALRRRGCRHRSETASRIPGMPRSSCRLWCRACAWA